MIVNLYRLPGDKERVAITTITNDDVCLGDTVRTNAEMEVVTGTKSWTIVSIDHEKGEADAVAATPPVRMRD